MAKESLTALQKSNQVFGHRASLMEKGRVVKKLLVNERKRMEATCVTCWMRVIVLIFSDMAVWSKCVCFSDFMHERISIIFSDKNVSFYV